MVFLLRVVQSEGLELWSKDRPLDSLETLGHFFRLLVPGRKDRVNARCNFLQNTFQRKQNIRPFITIAKKPQQDLTCSCLQPRSSSRVPKRRQCSLDQREREQRRRTKHPTCPRS